MIQNKIICNLCGKEMDIWDKKEEFSIHRRCGYGTKYDGETIELDICCDCMERLIDSCKVPPVNNKGDMMICNRCGNAFLASEHFDSVICDNRALIICPACAEYLSEYEEVLNSYIQRANTIEERRLHRNKHE